VKIGKPGASERLTLARDTPYGSAGKAQIMWYIKRKNTAFLRRDSVMKIIFVMCLMLLGLVSFEHGMPVDVSG